VYEEGLAKGCRDLRKDSKQKIIELMEKITKRTRREFFLLFIRLKSIEIGSKKHQFCTDPKKLDNIN